jgi:hypothetical protein
MVDAPPRELIDRAIEDDRRRAYFEGLAADYAALREDPVASADFDREMEEWDGTLCDGLDG